MRMNRKMAAATVAAVAIPLTMQTAGAEERGSFTALASLDTDYTTIEHAGGTIVGGTSAGTNTVIESSGAPFAVGGHSNIACVVYGKRSAAGLEVEAPCTSVNAAGDKLYSLSKRRAGGVGEGAGGAGSLELLGGTGKFAGVTGSCAYDVAYLAKGRLVSTMECEWRRSAGRK